MQPQDQNCSILCTGLASSPNILSSGVVSTVYRPTLTKFQNVGGLIANSPAEAAKDVGVLVIMVTNEAQAESVLYGDLGAVSALSSGASIILSSTVSPGFVSQLERRLQFLTPKVTFSKRVLSYIERQSFIGYS
ncbi:hypothetical protein WN943_001353 [Citrus x changshan-huyou]